MGISIDIDTQTGSGAPGVAAEREGVMPGRRKCGAPQAFDETHVRLHAVRKRGGPETRPRAIRSLDARA
jgi:hypothetical protein